MPALAVEKCQLRTPKFAVVTHIIKTGLRDAGASDASLKALQREWGTPLSLIAYLQGALDHMKREKGTPVDARFPFQVYRPDRESMLLDAIKILSDNKEELRHHDNK